MHMHRQQNSTPRTPATITLTPIARSFFISFLFKLQSIPRLPRVLDTLIDFRLRSRNIFLGEKHVGVNPNFWREGVAQKSNSY